MQSAAAVTELQCFSSSFDIHKHEWVSMENMETMKRTNVWLFWELTDQGALEIFGTRHGSSSTKDPRIIRQKLV